MPGAIYCRFKLTQFILTLLGTGIESRIKHKLERQEVLNRDQKY